MKKKLTIIAIVFLLMLSISGCVTFTSYTIHSIPYEFKDLIQGNSYSKNILIGEVVICNKNEDIQTVFDSFETFYPNETENIQLLKEILSIYTQDFFTNKSVILAIVQSKKGPYEYNTENILVKSDGSLTVQLTKENKEAEAGEFFEILIYEVNKSDIENVNNAGINIKTYLN